MFLIAHKSLATLGLFAPVVGDSHKTHHSDVGAALPVNKSQNHENHNTDTLDREPSNLKSESLEECKMLFYIDHLTELTHTQLCPVVGHFFSTFIDTNIHSALSAEGV